ncbi:hypothetical protein [Azospirillum griseum]|uniref:Uncharacterized protein n=1 Tax=Azospirillum griseum TaxID=2496639 RepID=A0A3S0K8W7_9PROT|nr:hypothetical protein [Azospirillum griseum]RTR16924.1 hypothetical protein EJ903_19610 [Azospirillum griseum]
MSSRVIVSLGIGILLTVLIGTVMVGAALLFYAVMTVVFAVVIAILTLATRRPKDRRDHGYL